MERVELFRGIMTILKDMVDEVTLDFDDNGLQFVTMDRMHISLTQGRLDAGLFCTFRCQKHLSLCVSVAELIKILSCGNDGDMMRLTYKQNPVSQDSDAGTLVIQLFGSIKGKFVLGTLASGSSAPDLQLPSLESFDLDLQLCAADLNQVCKNLKSFGDFASLRMKDNFLVVSTTGTKTQKASFSVPTLGPIAAEYEGMFNLENLGRILKSASLKSIKPTMRLLLCREMPLCALFSIGESPQSSSMLTFFLAPRVD
jgi:proliferating cell nuclear antigen PCNA